jgi:hypothetical protein
MFFNINMSFTAEDQPYIADASNTTGLGGSKRQRILCAGQQWWCHKKQAAIRMVGKLSTSTGHNIFIWLDAA